MPEFSKLFKNWEEIDQDLELFLNKVIYNLDPKQLDQNKIENAKKQLKFGNLERMKGNIFAHELELYHLIEKTKNLKKSVESESKDESQPINSSYFQPCTNRLVQEFVKFKEAMLLERLRKAQQNSQNSEEFSEYTDSSEYESS